MTVSPLLCLFAMASSLVTMVGVVSSDDQLSTLVCPLQWPDARTDHDLSGVNSALTLIVKSYQLHVIESVVILA